MVDNENQWDDIETTEEQNPSENETTEEYSDDYAEYEEDENEEDDEDVSSSKKKSNLLIIIILVILLLGVIGFVLVMKMGGNGTSHEIVNNPPQQNTEANNMSFDNNQNSTEAMGDAFFNEASNSGDMMNVDFNDSGEANINPDNEGNPDNGDSVATVSQPQEGIDINSNDMLNDKNNEMPNNNQPQENNKNGNVEAGEDLFAQNNNQSDVNAPLVIAYDKNVRKNPFKPPVVKNNDSPDIIEGLDVEIIEPPTKLVPDENLTKLLQTQISGILYDEESPSAIVNLNGMDQFVKIGDVISGYTIKDITKNQVMISYKNNSYVASVGELFTKGKLEKQSGVANLESKFAGRYKN